MTDAEIKKLAKANAHIPTEEIKYDIANTQEEIRRMTIEMDAFEAIGDKMSVFRATARRNGIKERQDFIKKLNMILSYREKHL